MFKRFLGVKLSIAAMLFVAWLSSCQRINQSSESKDFEDAKEFLYVQHATWVAVQIAEHINSTGSTLGLNTFMMDSLSKQLKSTYFIKDSSYLDNNGIEYELYFNPQNASIYNPYQHFTSYKFDGKLKVIIDQNYREIGSKSEIIIEESNPFMIDYPSFGMVKIFGTIEMERTAVSTINIKYKDFKVVFDSDKFNWDADIEYSWLSGAETDGLWNDQIQFKGNGYLAEQDDSNDKAEFSIVNVLTKSFEPGCSDYFQFGSLSLKTHDDEFLIDFDPFKNGSCSSLVRISNRKGELEFVGP
jgi:hypothetical protein